MSRFTIEFSEDADRSLDEAQKALGAKTKADVIRKAVNLLNYVIGERGKGGRLIIENRDENLRKEVVTI
jgi:hypothetical protein